MNSVLRYEKGAAHIYKLLKKIPRTGWVMKGVPDPETVYDHTVSLLKLSDKLSEKLGLTAEELDELKHILEVHDWAEAVVGDEFIPNEDNKSYQERKVKKKEKERKGLAELVHGREYERTVIELWNRYEEESDKMARLAQELDKFQALALSLKYEKQHHIKLFEEFYDYYKRDRAFSNKVIIQLVSKLKAEHARNLKQQDMS